MKKRTKSVNIGEIVEGFCRSLSESGRTATTVSNRLGDLKGLIRWFESRHGIPFDLREFVQKDVEDYRNWLANRFRPSTISRRITTLNTFATWAVQQGLLNENEHPRASNVSVKRKPNLGLSIVGKAELSRLREEVRASGRFWEIAIFALLTETGLRVGDLIQLCWKDISFSGNEATVTIKKSALKSWSPSLPIISKVATQALVQLRSSGVKDESVPIFQKSGRPISRRFIEMMIQRYARKAGLDGVTPRVLRHTYINNLVASGASPFMVAMLAGFQRPEMTSSYYRPGAMNFHPSDLARFLEKETQGAKGDDQRVWSADRLK